MKRLFLYVIAALLAVQGAWAAAPARYELKLRSGQKMRIDVCSDRIFRVRVTPADTFAESLLERYGLLKTDWEPVQVTQRNEGGVVVLGTPACRIQMCIRDSEEADYHGEQSNAFDQRRDDDHVRTDVVDRLGLACDGLHGRSADLADADAGADGGQSCAQGCAQFPNA